MRVTEIEFRLLLAEFADLAIMHRAYDQLKHLGGDCLKGWQDSRKAYQDARNKIVKIALGES